ncbi:hypothetical protein [Bacteroides cellulosilyticus]|uniref:hypothetical protein n=1 Tax=Bacteroides cellulosilyticus TaxID=246787 RepID=UPI003561E577
MKNVYFNIIGQKASGGKMIIMAVVPDDLFGIEVPNIFQVQAVRTVPTIFTGTYPTIRIVTDKLEARTDLTGKGIAGIVTGENWYNVSQEDKNEYGININP